MRLYEYTKLCTGNETVNLLKSWPAGALVALPRKGQEPVRLEAPDPIGGNKYVLVEWTDLVSPYGKRMYRYTYWWEAPDRAEDDVSPADVAIVRAPENGTGRSPGLRIRERVSPKSGFVIEWEGLYETPQSALAEIRRTIGNCYVHIGEEISWPE